MKLSKVIYAVFWGMLFLNFLPHPLSAQIQPSITIDINSEEISPNSFIEVKVFGSSENEINAFDITLEYSPEIFSFERAYTQDSVASLWKSIPFEGKDGAVSLVGGSVKPWSGPRNEIATLIFKARQTGASSFTVKNSFFALADGQGTKSELLEQSRNVVVSRDAFFANTEIVSIPPRIADAFIANDPLNNNNPIVVLETSDAGSIKWLGVRSRSWFLWNDWQKTQLTAAIPNSAWATQLKVLGFDGKETVMTLYRWKTVSTKIFTILVLFIIMIMVKRFFKRKRVASLPHLGLWLIFFIPITLLFFAPSVGASTLSVSPTSGSFSVGSTFDVQIFLDTEGQNINTLDVHLKFPPNALQVVSPTAGQSIVGVWTSPPTFDNKKGEIILQGGIPGGINANRGLVSTITFRARQVGNFTLKFSDDTRVLLNDGKGTDALNQTQGAVFQFVLPPPAGPSVASETHPDQNLWFSNSNALLRWTNTLPVSGYSFVLNDIPVFTPDNVVDSNETFVSYKDLPSGTNYFHIKALGQNGSWGGVTNFAIKVDTEPPAKFSVEAKPAPRTTEKTIFIYFNTTDTHSGIDRYEYSVVPLSPKYSPKEASAYQTFFVESNSPEVASLDKGRYDIVVRAYDKAGNFLDSTERVSILTPFVFYIANKWTLAVGLILIIVLALAYRRIRKWFISLEHRHNKKELPENVEKQLEELINYRSKYGVLPVLLGILGGIFMFSNQIVAQTEKTTKLPPPLITTVSRNISNEDIFYIGGKTENANVDVDIYLQNLGSAETRSFLVTSDENGNWFYRHPTFVSSGEYLLWTQSSIGELSSPPNPQVKMDVGRTAIQFGSNRLSFETLYLIVSTLLLIALVILTTFIISTAKKGRQKHKIMMKEIAEAEESVRRGFAVLKRDIKAELTVIHKNKTNKNISQEEKQKEEQLMKDLERVEKYIGKEIWDVEKYA